MAPPPFSNEYHFVLEPTEDKLHVSYELTYTERDSISEEEILTEGFTGDDDYAWQGSLPQVWQQALLEMVEKTQKLKPNLSKNLPNLVKLQVTHTDGKAEGGVPDNLEGWEYFLQELTQAVFEISQKERPLVIRYRRVNKSKQATDLTVQTSFSQRKLEVSIQREDRSEQRYFGWEKLKPLLKAVYLPDYDSSRVKLEAPAKQGKFIDPGEGIWYDMKKDLSNPGKQYDAVAAMTTLLEEFLD